MQAGPSVYSTRQVDVEVADQVLSLDFAARFLPQGNQGTFVFAHYESAIRAANAAAHAS
jgi:hypothetical protein